MRTKGNIELLRLMNLPVFSNENELANLIHIEAKHIKLLSQFSHRYYRHFKIPKSKSGFREIRCPRRDLKAIQSWILRNILDNLTPSIYATAYIKKRNISNNILPHCNNRYFLCLDLDDFFPSISFNRIYKILYLVGYSKKAASLVALLCTCKSSLPQGGVTSPSLSNLIAAKLDRRIVGYTSRRNITYTRYSDDITLSSNNPEILNKSLPRILKIIKSEHFKPNFEKLRIMGPRRRCQITGLVKNNSESNFGVGRYKKREIRVRIHHLLVKKTVEPEHNKDTEENSIIGWLNYLKGVDPSGYGQMHNYWEVLNEKTTRNNV